MALLALATAGCGGSSGGSRTGTGGAGGSAGHGGSSGSGGGTGGGSGGSTADASTALNCSPGVNPTMPLLSDFSSTSWRNTAGKWGIVGNLTGSIFAYHGTSATTWPTMPSVDTVNENLTVMGMVAGGDYAGIGMSFDQCVNTTTYTGLQYTLGGDFGGCSVQFQVQTFEQQGASNHGGCTSNPDAGISCYNFPRVTPPMSMMPGSFTVRWTDLMMGAPTGAAAIAAEIVGFQWQMVTNAPASDGGADAATGAQQPCTVSMTVDDVQFITN
jgi:hypothetical protein